MFADLAAGARQTAARSTLAGLMTWLGEAGIVAAFADPSLLAEVDQHAAAVRDALGDPEGGPGAVSLAGYACGVRDAAISGDWIMPDPATIDWAEADWPTLRLLGVSALARAYGLA